MENNILTIIDLANSINQIKECLITAYILEKRCAKLCLLDLNCFNHKIDLISDKSFSKKGDFLSTKCFDNTTLNLLNQENFSCDKLFKFASDQAIKSDRLIIRANLLQDKINEKFIKMSNELMIFYDLTNNNLSQLMNFFIKQSLNNKKVLLFLYNYKENIQIEKMYLDIVKTFRNQNVKIIKLDNIPEYKNVHEIEEIDPWQDIYKKINGAF